MHFVRRNARRHFTVHNEESFDRVGAARLAHYLHCICIPHSSKLTRFAAEFHNKTIFDL